MPAPPPIGSYHTPVLAREVVALLRGGRHVLDGTVGGGGHAQALLDAGAAEGVETVVTAVDRDPEALAAARSRLAAETAAGRFHSYLGNYAALDDLPALEGARFDGILLDLGVSSHQFDAATRGFSFREGSLLDMRMSAGEGLSAAELLATSTERELAVLFRTYADEPRAGRLAREIVRRRARESFTTSDHLVRAIRGALGPRSGPADFARLFQGLRIAVNDELPGLERALPSLRDRLLPGGVFVIIAYHSGEDRLVKHAFRAWSTACTCPPRQPVCTCGGCALGELVTRRSVTASAAEIEANPRARSARLRAWRRAA